MSAPPGPSIDPVSLDYSAAGEHTTASTTSHHTRLVEDVARHGAEADAAIREGRSPLPAAPDEEAINRICVELTDLRAEQGS